MRIRAGYRHSEAMNVDNFPPSSRISGRLQSVLSPAWVGRLSPMKELKFPVVPMKQGGTNSCLTLAWLIPGSQTAEAEGLVSDVSL